MTARRLLAALALAIGTLLATGLPAGAHSDLVSATPSRAASVSGVDRVQLEFSSAVLDRLAQVVVADESGHDHVVGRPATFYTRVVARVGDLDAGRYTVSYRVVAADGHPITGSYAFEVAGSGVTAEVAAPAAVATSTQPPPSAGGGAAAAPSGGAPWLVPLAGGLAVLLVVGLRVLHGLRARPAPVPLTGRVMT